MFFANQTGIDIHECSLTNRTLFVPLKPQSETICRGSGELPLQKKDLQITAALGGDAGSAAAAGLLLASLLG